MATPGISIGCGGVLIMVRREIIVQIRSIATCGQLRPRRFWEASMDKLRQSRRTALLAMAVGSVAVMAATPVHSNERAAQSAYIVMVEFSVKPEESEAVVATVRGLLDTIVHKQDGFQLARIHREIGGGKVINYMQWRNKDAFDSFRAAHKEQVSAAIGKFGPKFVFYQVPYAIEPKQ